MAHRGASGLAPENTLAALKSAMTYDADFAEIDVNLTRDGEVVLMHDDSVTRTTNAFGKLRDLDYKEVSALDAGSWFSPMFISEKVPTLADAIELVRGRMRLNIEIKNRSVQGGLTGKVVEVLEREDFNRDCIVTSFDRQAILELRKRNPDITSGLITHSGIPSELDNGIFDVLSCHYSIVDRDLIAHIHGIGKTIIVWTVNQIVYMKRFIKMGIDGIITDRPDRLQKVIQSDWFAKNRSSKTG